MLFITCELEGRLVEMLIDSGASTSAISLSQVKRLGLDKHLNRNIQGKAVGCGNANIEGVLENVACQMGHVEFHLFFLVLDTTTPCLILGLDLMRRFNCIIDLETNNLIFGGKGGVCVPFLPPDAAADAATRTFTPTRSPAVTADASSRGFRLGSFFGRR